MKNAIVVGATSGIGRELARNLVNDGYNVVITGRRTELLEELKKEDKNKYIAGKIDIRNVVQTEIALTEIVNKLGTVDLIIICSGLGGDNEELIPEKEIEIATTNVIGFTGAVNWAYHMCTKQTHGHIVAITSVAGLRGNRRAPAYFSSKAYQIKYMESLKQKCNASNKNILITDIRPGFVDTAMLSNKKLIWTISPQKAAIKIYRAIKQKKQTAYIPKRWRSIAYILKSIPQLIYNRL